MIDPRILPRRGTRKQVLNASKQSVNSSGGCWCMDTSEWAYYNGEELQFYKLTELDQIRFNIICFNEIKYPYIGYEE